MNTRKCEANYDVDDDDDHDHDDDDNDDDNTTFLVNVEDTNMKVSTYEPNYHHHHHHETSSSSSSPPPPPDPLLPCNSFTITESNCSTATVTNEVANINKLGCQSLTFRHYHHQYHHHHHYYYNRKPKCSDFKHYSEIPNSSTGGDDGDDDDDVGGNVVDWMATDDSEGFVASTILPIISFLMM